MKTLAPEPRPWEVLVARGAHCVLCAPSKKALSVGWQKKPGPDLEAVIAHARSAGHIAVIPWSLGCVVIDVDDGGTAAVEAVKQVLGTPVAITTTQREGGFHLWYRTDTAEGNRKWALSAGGGDIRGAKGYAILWDIAGLAAGLVANYDGAVPVQNLSKLLPRPKSGGATGPEAVSAALPGHRNDALNLQAFRAASRGTLDKDEPELRKAGHAIGLEPGEIDATIASARAGGLAAPTFERLDKDALVNGLSLMGVELRYNVRRQRAEIKNGTKGWVDKTDRWSGKLRTELARRFQYQASRGTAPLAYGPDGWNVCVNSILHDNECDPFLDYIEAVPEWDGIERVGHWLEDTFEVDPKGDRDLLAWASQFVFLGAVWRAYRAGNKAR